MFTKAKTNLSGGIVGLANVGKSTLFHALTKTQQGIAANYPFATIDPEEGRVVVPSPRLDQLAEVYHPKKVVPASFQVVDIAGLVKGASKGQGLGNAFLSHIRAVDGLFQVVRFFDDAEIVHVEDSVDPIRDAQTIHDELVLKDMEFVTNALIAAAKRRPKEARVYEAALKVLESGRRVDQTTWTLPEIEVLRPLTLLTTKPSVFVANVSEEEWCFGDPHAATTDLKNWINEWSPGSAIVPLSVPFEARLAAMSDADRASELAELETTSRLAELITTLRSGLGLQSFFTAGSDEVREWTLREGSLAPQAAAAIHTDFEETFITAQVLKISDIIEFSGDESALRKAGRVQMKGKDYAVCDGDVLEIRAGARKR